jgi:hypothetical protein
MLDVLSSMRLAALLVAATLAAPLAHAQGVTPTRPSTGGDAAEAQDPPGQGELPVSLARIKGALEQPPAPPLRGLNEAPTFKIAIEEKQRIKLEDLINSLDFKSGPTPAGGLYAYEQQRQMFPAVDNPLRQPFSEFSQPELLTVLVENLAGHYLAGRAASAITSAERARAEARARDEVARAVVDYCAAQPHGGAGIQICVNPGSIR